MIWIIATVAAVFWLVVVRNGSHARIAKPVASAGFIATAVDAGALHTTYGSWILGGLILGAVGDIALITKKGFVLGLAAFGLGHVAYVVAFAGRSPISWPWIGIAAVVGVATLVWLLPHIDASMKFPIITYVVIISAMLGVALHPDQSAMVRLGAPLFAASDLLVARERFVLADDRNRLWGLPLYYASQILIALSAAI